MMDDDFNDLDKPKSRGLGRGLDAIFGEDEASSDTDVSRETFTPSASEPSANEIVEDELKRRMMPVEWLKPRASQPRKYFDQAALEDLAKSIMMHGILQAIVVRPMEDQENTYEIIAGERRWRAAQLMQMHEVPVSVQYLDDDAVLEIALIENIQRENLTPIEEAKAFQQLMDLHGHTQEKLSVTLGKSRPYITNALRLLTLPEAVQEMVNKGDLTMGHARTLVGKDNAEELARQIISDNLSVRAAEALAKSGKPPKESPSGAHPSKPEKDVNTLALEEEITRILGLSVTLYPSAGGTGYVKIDYKSLDQLESLLHRLSGV